MLHQMLHQGYSDRMIRMHIIKARGESGDSLLERENNTTFESRITYYPAFQNIRRILQELQILLARDKEHKKVFLEALIVGFRNGKSLEALNHARRVLVKYVIIQLQLTFLQQKHMGKYLKFKVLIDYFNSIMTIVNTDLLEKKNRM